MQEDHIALSADRAWQDQANCLGVDPDLFSPSVVHLPVKQKKCARAVLCARIASNTHSQMAKNSAFGAVFPSVSDVDSDASVLRLRATSLAHK